MISSEDLALAWTGFIWGVVFSASVVFMFIVGKML